MRENFFRQSYHVGKHFRRFKILVTAEDVDHFSGTPQENDELFRQKMHNRYIQPILDAFAKATEELGINLGDNNIANFFGYYSYYWFNRNAFDDAIHNRIRDKVDGAESLDEVICTIGAQLILSADVVGGERFRRKFEFDEFWQCPIFVNAPANREMLKEIFKRYLKNFRSGMDEVFDRLAEQIAEGKSPLDAFDEIFVNDISIGDAPGGGFNTFPMGEPSRLYTDLLIICEDPMCLESMPTVDFYGWHMHNVGTFDYINRWCRKTQGKFSMRRVRLLTDKWTTQAYKCYENRFRRLAKNHGVDFEFYLFALGAEPAEINLPF